MLCLCIFVFPFILASGWSVGDCLKEHPDQLPAACLSFIGTMDSCHSDIDSFCAGKEYSGEVISCLLDWTSPDKLDPACLVALEAFRPKAKTEQKKQSKEDREKANKRRKVRQEAARRAGREL